MKLGPNQEEKFGISRGFRFIPFPSPRHSGTTMLIAHETVGRSYSRHYISLVEAWTALKFTGQLAPRWCPVHQLAKLGLVVDLTCCASRQAHIRCVLDALSSRLVMIFFQRTNNERKYLVGPLINFPFDLHGGEETMSFSNLKCLCTPSRLVPKNFYHPPDDLVYFSGGG